MRRDVFQAIADPIRREIIEMLSAKPMTVNEVANKFKISRPAISKHLKILNECQLISYDQIGRERWCIIKPKELVPAFMWIKKYNNLWEDRIDSFENYINKIKDEQTK